MSPGARHFDYWFTSSEFGSDRRTGASAMLVERPRREGDRRGKHSRVWDWAVSLDRKIIARGTAQTQGGARRKCRDVVEKLPKRRR